MMMPGQPASNLVMIHAGCFLGILKGAFNKKSLPLHIGKPLRGGLGRCIGKAVFYGLLRVDLAPDYKVPLADGLFFVEPNPDLPSEDVHLEPPFRGNAVLQTVEHQMQATKGL
ncbi:MAG: hypothetical protein L6365_10335 [Desulfobulbaceae bacterium]|nr:hypothetical protein [Desulfobulbaceae bacterium]